MLFRAHARKKSPAPDCCFDGTAWLGGGGGSVRASAAERRVVGGMKAFGGAFMACGLSL